MSILDYSMLTLGQQLRRRQLSVPELVKACLARDSVTQDLNAFNAVYREQAQQLAQASQIMLEQGYDLGPLHGMPIAVKANINLAGQEMHAGSQVLSGSIAQQDASVVQCLKQAGAIIIGSTNMHEFAWGGPPTIRIMASAAIRGMTPAFLPVPAVAQEWPPRCAVHWRRSVPIPAGQFVCQHR